MNKREISAILRESIFKPSESTGLMCAILDANNRDYYASRAVECVRMAQDSEDRDFILEQLTIAISLLALVKYEIAK